MPAHSRPWLSILSRVCQTPCRPRQRRGGSRCGSPAHPAHVHISQSLESRVLLSANPVVGNFNGSTNYVTNVPVLVDADVTVTDADSPNFDGGELEVAAGVQSSSFFFDVEGLNIRSVGNGPGQVSVANNKVFVGGVEIGTVNVGDRLNVFFNANATPQRVRDVIRNVIYDGSYYGESQTSVALSLWDGDGGFTTASKKLIHLNSNPVLSGFADPRSFSLGVATQVDQDAAVSDVDGEYFDGGRLVFSLTANKQAGDLLYLPSEGFLNNQVFVEQGKVFFSNREVGTVSGGGVSPLVITFNTGDEYTAPYVTAEEVQAIIRKVAFKATTGSALNRTLQLTVIDGRGGSGSASKLLVQNPALGSFTNPTSFSLNVPVLVDSDATLVDADSPNFAGGRLVFDITANKKTGDLLYIHSVGNGAGQVSVSGGKVFVAGVEVGTVSGGGTAPLTVALNGNATAARVQAVIRHAAFKATTVSSLQRTLRLTVTDGDGGSTTAAKLLDQKPVLGAFADTTGFVTNSAVLVDGDATFADADSANLANGQFVFNISSNKQAGDLLFVQHVGTGGGQVSVSAGKVFVGGVEVGTVSGGGAAPLTVTFNANATTERAQLVLRNVAFKTTSASNLVRTLQLTATDGDGGWATAAKSLSRGANIAPVLGAFTNSMTFMSNIPVLVDADATLTDADSANLAGGQLVFNIISNRQSGDLLYVQNVGNGPGQVSVSGGKVFVGGVEVGTVTGGGTAPLVVTFNANATAARAQAVLRNVVFHTTSNSLLARSLQLTVTDGDGGTAAADKLLNRFIRM